MGMWQGWGEVKIIGFVGWGGLKPQDGFHRPHNFDLPRGPERPGGSATGLADTAHGEVGGCEGRKVKIMGFVCSVALKPQDGFHKPHNFDLPWRPGRPGGSATGLAHALQRAHIDILTGEVDVEAAIDNVDAGDLQTTGHLVDRGLDAVGERLGDILR